jgi:hypothetical protein
MAGKGKEDEELSEDEKVTEVVEHFEMLDTIEQMRKTLEGVKLSLKNKEKEMQDAGEIPVDILLLLKGNSAEKIAELEKEYDFADVSLRDCEQAKKWFQAARPSASKQYGPIDTSSYRLWLKWNLSRMGTKSKLYKGDLVRKREEEAGVAVK